MPVVTRIELIPGWLKSIGRPIAHRYWRIRDGIAKRQGRTFKHIVVCGYPRSGTSLLFNMLSASLPKFYFDEFESSVLQRLHRYGDYVTKSPSSIFDIGQLQAHNVLKKSISVIVLNRDIRDVVTSRHPLLPDRYFIGYDRSWWPEGPDLKLWGYTGPGIQSIYECTRRLLEVDTGITVVNVKYEELLARTESVQAGIGSALEIGFSGDFSAYYRHPEKLPYRYAGRFAPKDASYVREDKPLDSSRVSKWRKLEHRERIREQFERFPQLFDILIEGGYENSRDWFKPFTSPVLMAHTE